MAATITYDDGTGAPRVFTLSDTILKVLEQFRQSVTVFDSTTKSMIPKYPTIADLLRGFLNDSTMLPAINAFPPAEVVTARQQVTVAQENLAAVVTTAITGALQG